MLLTVRIPSSFHFFCEASPDRVTPGNSPVSGLPHIQAPICRLPVATYELGYLEENSEVNGKGGDEREMSQGGKPVKIIFNIFMTRFIVLGEKASPSQRPVTSKARL